MIVVSDKLSTESFHAFIDEQLNDEQYLQVEEQLEEFPEKVEEIQQCQIINERLREVFDSIVEEPLPRDLYELALYGVTSEKTDDELEMQQYGYEFDEGLNEVTGYQDDISSPMDSMHSALELQDEEFIDSDEFADLEALSGQEGLADFDIDALSGNRQGIIPDIFDEEEGHSELESSYEPTTSIPAHEAMLDSLDDLYLEPLEDEPDSGQPTASDSFHETDLETSGSGNSDISETLESPDLELESLEQAEQQESQSISDTEFPTQAEQQASVEASVDEQTAARERVLKNLEASEDLSLEPVEAEATNEVNNLPADSSDHDVSAESMASSPDEQVTDEQVTATAEIPERNVLYGEDNAQPEKNSNAGESIETESQADGVHVMSEQVPDIDSQSELENGTDALLDTISSAEEPMNLQSGNKSDPEYPIDEIVHELDELPNGENEVPQDVVAEFFAENKTESDFEVSEVVKHFDEVSDDFSHHQHGPFDSPVAQFKQKADNVLNVLNSKFYAFKKNVLNKEDDDLPDFNKAPVLPDVETRSNQRAKSIKPSEDDYQTPFNFGLDSENNNDFDATPGTGAKSPISNPFSESPDTFDFDVDVGVGEETQPAGISAKIGDTLRDYKKKRLQQQDADSEAAAAANHGALTHYEELTGFAKYKSIARQAVNKVSPENRMTIGGVILLVIGLVIGGSTANLANTPVGNSISADKVERLAIDAHILYTQQDQNFAGNPSTSITESMQWLSARIGRQIRLADVQMAEFKHQRAIIMPTMVSYATANIFENKNKEMITLFIAANPQGVANSALTCRVPSGVDGLCSWVKDSMYYVAIANLSLSRVRAFSQEMVEKL